MIFISPILPKTRGSQLHFCNNKLFIWATDDVYSAQNREMCSIDTARKRLGLVENDVGH